MTFKEAKDIVEGMVAWEDMQATELRIRQNLPDILRAIIAEIDDFRERLRAEGMVP